MNNLTPLLRKAQATNAQRDKMEHDVGFANPGEGPGRFSDLLRTAILALEAGVQTKDWNCVGEALVFLNDCYVTVHGKGFSETGKILGGNENGTDTLR